MTDENKEVMKGFEALFPSFTTVTLETSEGKLPIIGINEVPMNLMAKFVDTPDGEKVSMMADLMQSCLVNPADWERLSSVSVMEFNELIEQWVKKSATIDND